MTIRGLIAAFTQQEDLNFLLTNRIWRAALTRFMGWFSKIENPLVRTVDRLLAAVFRPRPVGGAQDEFKSLHDCFTRELRPGLRPADPDPGVVASPSRRDHRRVRGTSLDTELFQIKGAPYSLLDLLGDPALVERHRNGRFLTLRLTSSMYHRFHAPNDAQNRAGDPSSTAMSGTSIRSR